MSNKHRVNPTRIPVTMADLKRAKAAAADDAIAKAFAIMLTVLVDKEGYDYEKVKHFWGYVCGLSDSIQRGYVNVTDLMYTLREEYGIVLGD